MVVFPPRAIDQMAERIERAYLRRRPPSFRDCPHSGVWGMAAAILAEMHRHDPVIPLDPELFVASQTIDPESPDPWKELTRPIAKRRYRRRIMTIIRQLRRELHAEVRWAERQLQDGTPLEQVLSSRRRCLSGLGRFIVAFRAERADLAELFREDAQQQHRSCPLFRQACLDLIPVRSYPVLELLPGFEPMGRAVSGELKFSLN